LGRAKNGGVITNDGDIVLRSLKLPQSNVNGDTTFTLSLQFVQNPGILEGALAKLSGFLLKLLDGTLVNTTALSGSQLPFSSSKKDKLRIHKPCRSSDR
jgi:hypothetical protein